MFMCIPLKQTIKQSKNCRSTISKISKNFNGPLLDSFWELKALLKWWKILLNFLLETLFVIEAFKFGLE